MRRILKFDALMKKGMVAGAALGVLTAVVVGVGSSMGAELVSIPGPEEPGTAEGNVGGSSGGSGSAPSEGLSDGGGSAQAENSQGITYGWRLDFDGYRRYYGQDGMVLTNTITPDGQYVEGTGVWIPQQYDVSQFTSIPADAKSLLVIEGHGTCARASFYVKEEVSVRTDGEAGNLDLSQGPGAADQAGSQGKQEADIQADSQGKQEAAAQAASQGKQEAAAQAESQGKQEAGAQADAQAVLSYRWKKLTDTGGYVGKQGIGKEREGDEKTPRGLYTLDEAFGTKPDLGNFKVPYLQVNDGHYWVGDSNSPLYNTMADIRQTGQVFDTAASEHLSTYGGKAYHYCMAVGYNKERTPYKGSAIFLHCTDGPGTGGCIAIPEEAMVTVLQNIEMPAYILIDDGENLKGY